MALRSTNNRLNFFIIVASVLLLLFPLDDFAQQTQKPDWSGFKFLIGDWIGEGSGAPGEGSGTITFYLALDDQILVRKNHAEYPAANGRPAFTHDDVTIHYRENNSVRAIYFDNEGHTIHYSAAFSPDSSALILTSDINQAAPRFRFTYQKIENGRLKVTFEIAPPGKPDEFKKYVEGIVKKKI